MSKKGGRDLLRSVHRSLLHRYSTAATTTAPLMEEASERYCYRPSLRWNPQVEEYFIKAHGADHFSRISEALTRPPCYSCIRVNKLKSTSDAVIEKLSSTLQDKGKQSAISHVKRSDDDAEYNIGKNQKVINGSNTNLDSFECEDIVLKGLEIAQNGSISKCQLPGLDYVLFVKGSGPHTINYNYDNEKPPKEIIVSRKCAEAVLRGAQVYVPGVLACSAHVEKGDAVAVSVAVEQPCEEGGWGVGITRGITLQGLETDPHFAERRGLYIGQGTAMLSRAGMFRVLEGIAVDMNERVYKLPSFNDVLAGEIFLQNLPSIIAAHVLDPQEGERILDMCAAPGGKTTAIALLMNDKGEVVAVDRSHNKVLNIQKLAAELGLKCIVTYKLDALKAVQQKTESNDAPTLSSAVQEPDTDVTLKENKDNNQATQAAYRSKAEARKNLRRLKNGPGRSNCGGGRVGKSLGFPPKSFDRVLLDAPCSALGLRPRLFSGEETIASLRSDAKYQRKMFDQAVQLVRPGGVLVYSTCTINPGENEALVRYALDTYKFLSLAPQHPKVGGPGLVGGCELSDGYKEEWLRPGEEELVQRFDTSSPLDTIGFFIAKFNVGPYDT